jgi:ABC-type transport system involved in multi-copper enzyme maturation permease subunit
MIKVWRRLATLATITMLEGARKQIFHVLMLFAMTLIVISTLLGFLDHNVQMKIIKDLVTVAIMISSGLIAITLSVGGLPQEVELRTVYPIMAKPMRRWEFVVGKYLGTVITVALGMLIMLVAFCGILYAYGGHVSLGVFLVMPFLLLEASIVAAIGVLLSTFCSTPLAWFITVFVFVIGAFKFQLSEFLSAKDHSAAGKIVETIGYQVLPNLECFNFKDSLVHDIPVSGIYMLQTALYGVVYITAVLTLASLVFARKEL